MDDKICREFITTTPKEIKNLDDETKRTAMVGEAMRLRVLAEEKYRTKLRIFGRIFAKRIDEQEYKGSFEQFIVQSMINEVSQQCDLSDVFIFKMKCINGPLDIVQGYASDPEVKNSRDEILKIYHEACTRLKEHLDKEGPKNAEKNFKYKEEEYRCMLQKVEAMGEGRVHMNNLIKAKHDMARAHSLYQEELEKMVKVKKNFKREMMKARSRMGHHSVYRIELLQRAVKEYLESLTSVHRKKNVRRDHLGYWNKQLSKIVPKELAALYFKEFPLSQSDCSSGSQVRREGDLIALENEYTKHDVEGLYRTRRHETEQCLGDEYTSCLGSPSPWNSCVEDLDGLLGDLDNFIDYLDYYEVSKPKVLSDNSRSTFRVPRPATPYRPKDALPNYIDSSSESECDLQEMIEKKMKNKESEENPFDESDINDDGDDVDDDDGKDEAVENSSKTKLAVYDREKIKSALKCLFKGIKKKKDYARSLISQSKSEKEKRESSGNIKPEKESENIDDSKDNNNLGAGSDQGCSNDDDDNDYDNSGRHNMDSGKEEENEKDENRKNSVDATEKWKLSKKNRYHFDRKKEREYELGRGLDTTRHDDDYDENWCSDDKQLKWKFFAI